MALAYTKDFLVSAYLSRYVEVHKTETERAAYSTMTNNFYDKVGKDKFRIYASLDAEAIRNYKKSLLK